jgi:membrane protease subunit HflC
LEEEVKTLSAIKLNELGIDLIDVRFKRVNHNRQVLASIFQRMTTERQQIAQGFRSEGEGRAAAIIGEKERKLSEIDSGAYKAVLEIQGDADAEASRIYAEAYNKSPQAAEFYAFLKTLETYRTVLSGNSTLVLSTDSDLFRLLKTVAPKPVH